jgi:hypothetical protein
VQRCCEARLSFFAGAKFANIKAQFSNRSARNQFFEVLHSRSSKGCGWTQTPKLGLNRPSHFGLEESMPEYEVLILDKDANPAAFIETQQADDEDAIRSAVRIANGRPFEVWRDIVCVHRARPEPLTGRAA